MSSSKLYRYALLITVAGFAALVGSQSARAQSPRRHWHPRPSFTVSLVSPGGAPLRTFMHMGQTFVLGEPGVRYSIRIRNPTSQRVEAVVSVDGRDAITGQVADFVHHRGYVIRPFGSVTVTGFRQSLQQVAAFRFTNPGDSYSSRMGTPQNVGVVGVAFFTERERQPIAIEEPRREDRVRAPRASSAPRAKRGARHSGGADTSAAPAEKSRARAAGRGGFEPEQRRSANNLGTQYGESRFSPVRQVSFMRQSPMSPARIVLLRYDDEDGLEARGIQVRPHWRELPRPVQPQAFPATRRFAPPPP